MDNQSQLVPERWLLLIAVAMVVAYTLAPFEFSFVPLELGSRLKETLDFRFTDGPLDAVGHFAAFFILGGLIAAVYERFFQAWCFGRFAWVALGFCGSLELFQLFEESRHARATDLLCNMLGILLGAKCTTAWNGVRAVRLTLLGWCRRYPIHAQAILAVLASAIWVGAGISRMPRLSRMDWDQSFHLLVGRELDREGPWLGEIRYLGIYGRALNAEQALLVFERPPAGAGDEVRDELDLLVGYDFKEDGGNVVLPKGPLQSGVLSLQVPMTCESLKDRGGLLIKEPSLLTSRGPASDLSAAIVSSGEFSVEAWLRPLNATQGKGEPARIVSLSQGIWWRNFMLGQEADELVFRVRNGVNGPNGLYYALRLRGAVREGLQHFVAVYDHGVSLIFRDGRLLKPVLDLRDPAVYTGLGNNAGGHAAAGMLLVLTVALPMYSMFPFMHLYKLRHVAAILTTFLIGSLPYVVSCILVGGPWRSGLFVWLGIALFIVYPLSLFYVRR